MTKLIKKIGVSLMAVAGLIGATAVKAAADADLEAGLASTTAIFTDNKGAIIGWVVAIVGVTIIVGLVVKAVFFGKRQALGMLGGGKRRR